MPAIWPSVYRADTVQIGSSAEQWAIAAIYSRIQNGNDLIVYGTNFALDSFANPGSTSAFALSGYWQPVASGWIPLISAGWGLNATRLEGCATHSDGNTVWEGWYKFQLTDARGREFSAAGRVDQNDRALLRGVWPRRVVFKMAGPWHGPPR